MKFSRLYEILLCSSQQYNIFATARRSKNAVDIF